MEYGKLFYEEKSAQFFDTLKEATKGASTSDGRRVYRVWVDENTAIVGQQAVFDSGGCICPVKWADKLIEDKLNTHKA